VFDAGCYNPKSKIPTPNIDSLANAGMRFTAAHSPGALLATRTLKVDTKPQANERR
jgi:arylsulfatase A-like enzyme